MTRCAVSTAAFGSLALHLALGTAFAQIPVRLGGEFQINSVTVNNQYTVSGSVAIENNGDFVVVWAGDDGFYGVFARRFSSSGAPIGGEFQVNLFTPGYQVSPAVASDDDGDFVVVWASGSLGEFVVLARRFDSSGGGLASEFQVNVQATNANNPSVAREAGGDFVVAWIGYGRDGSGWGVFASRFNSSGAALGTDFQVNDYTLNHQLGPAIDLDQDGDFVIAWYSPHDGFDSGIFGKRFNSAGAAQGSEFQVNVFTDSVQRYPVIGLDTDGDFIVAWHSYAQDGPDTGVFARRFVSSGAPLGGEIQINSYTMGHQIRPSLGVDGDGDFVVAWKSYASGGPGDIFARHFRASGVPTSGDILVNSTVAGTQQSPAVGADPDGDFVVAWSSFGQDGSLNGIFGQRFDVPALLDIDANGQITALTDGLLVLRFLFGFTGATLTAGAVGPNCARCDNATILPYLQSLT